MEKTNKIKELSEPNILWSIGEGNCSSSGITGVSSNIQQILQMHNEQNIQKKKKNN